MNRLILASGSPRRKELLQNVFIPFEVSVSHIEEHISDLLPPSQIVEQLAHQKANAVYEQHRDCVVLGADTVVTLDENILGKPKNKEDVRQMLLMLSGRKHLVYTGVAIISREKTCLFHGKTEVTFYDLTDEEIHAYISSGEPYDKAGGYGIQGLGAVLVQEIHGDYFNVVGLPLARTVRELKKFGITLST
ncbi:Maf family protein [Bacillus taeanensis]|uniref:dTTP/UTP pyrophosphatase n=1 Tax=Bacillus taeanensis TaxID=273032 RepID=A0A366Y5A2_9BACI|nr:Maf family protein [Bacillus taeanensis]RBW71593.1 septum formation inhibitor Maf [Bacillus taeanensis]